MTTRMQMKDSKQNLVSQPQSGRDINFSLPPPYARKSFKLINMIKVEFSY